MKNIWLYIFAAIALIQLCVPAQMIWNREDIIESGTVFKFKTAPIDPNDPFRGKYINLQFSANTFPVDAKEKWTYNDPVYVVLKQDAQGFAIIKNVQKHIPEKGHAYIKAKVAHTIQEPKQTVVIDYPFTRFYMEESKAYKAEHVYRETLQDTSKVTYAIVSVKEGGAVLREVMVNGIPIRELADNTN